ncbi:BQ5605_C048g12359 [Microbotryum silenes-dioicae]|uniref:BQ5605_C048g12359 protein n=1 Tax=Microbotryum silenes-dioicae TaxID=796604 RepID=A0A2X0MSI6_9BASI|nr:BQ5605_C048g12359 [Microbotryum silenes-dioicae]
MKVFVFVQSLVALGALASATPDSNLEPHSDLDKRCGLSLLKGKILGLGACGILQGGIGGCAGSFGPGGAILNSGLNVRVRCPLSFQCDGSGTDGYPYDVNGNGCPSYLPQGWMYYGVQTGWQPPISYTCGANWVAPSQWTPYAHLAPWWSAQPLAAGPSKYYYKYQYKAYKKYLHYLKYASKYSVRSIDDGTESAVIARAVQGKVASPGPQRLSEAEQDAKDMADAEADAEADFNHQ